MDSFPEAPPAKELAERLVRILAVEPVERNFFSGIATPDGQGRVYGGQIIGQAMAAAIGTIDEGKVCHSLHAYFMRAGDATKPVLYQVERDFDGRSFSTRRVIAIQEGRPILNMATSFHIQEPGMAYQDTMPDVPPPEELENEEQLAERYKANLPDNFHHYLRFRRLVELRPTELPALFTNEVRAPVQHAWFRARAPLPADPNIHRAALAYISDMDLLGACFRPHGKRYFDPDLQFASLDHALWLHDECRVDEWMLYSMDSPWTGSARGLARGRVFTRDGRLVANVTQEALIRKTDL